MPALLRGAGLSGARVAYGGQTALADDTVTRVLDDLARVASSPCWSTCCCSRSSCARSSRRCTSCASSILGLLATLGADTLFFQGVLGQDDLTYYVPFAAAVLLVALGSDYNVFVAGRIWEEARRMRLREAIAVAAPQAARAVTVAGLALASSFALLAIVPLRSFREFAFVMAVGVLIDTFIVRTLLVPALTSLFGERAWWPGRRVRRLSSASSSTSSAGARACRARAPSAPPTRPSSRSPNASRRARPHVLAAQLPRELRGLVLSPPGGTERFGAAEFVRRVGEREGVDDDEATAHARAVLRTLDEAVAGDLDYVRAQLSSDYAPLFDGH